VLSSCVARAKGLFSRAIVESGPTPSPRRRWRRPRHRRVVRHGCGLCGPERNVLRSLRWGHPGRPEPAGYDPMSTATCSGVPRHRLCHRTFNHMPVIDGTNGDERRYSSALPAGRSTVTAPTTRAPSRRGSPSPRRRPRSWRCTIHSAPTRALRWRTRGLDRRVVLMPALTLTVAVEVRATMRTSSTTRTPRRYLARWFPYGAAHESECSTLLTQQHSISRTLSSAQVKLASTMKTRGRTREGREPSSPRSALEPFHADG